jgi:hydroxymethylglutaryl-CoA lyase
MNMVGHFLLPKCTVEVLWLLPKWLLLTAACPGLFFVWLRYLKSPEISSKLASEDWRIISTIEGIEVSKMDKSIKICLINSARGNSLSTVAIHNITLLFQNLSVDNSIKRVLLTGQGRFFCTGVDLHEDLYQSSTQKRVALQELFRAIELCPHTTVAAINGPAFGGGVGLAFACDIRIAIGTSFFCLSEVKLGLCPAMISKVLVREWGTSFARMAMLTGNRIPSHRLYEIGAIHHLAKDLEDLNSITERVLKELQCSAPQASTWNKSLVREIANVAPSVDSFCGRIFESMVTEGSESSYGVKKFRAGTREICWDEV